MNKIGKVEAYIGVEHGKTHLIPRAGLEAWRTRGARVLREATPDEVRAWRAMRTRGRVSMEHIDAMIHATKVAGHKSVFMRHACGLAGLPAEATEENE